MLSSDLKRFFYLNISYLIELAYNINIPKYCQFYFKLFKNFRLMIKHLNFCNLFTYLHSCIQPAVHTLTGWRLTVSFLIYIM